MLSVIPKPRHEPCAIVIIQIDRIPALLCQSPIPSKKHPLKLLQIIRHRIKTPARPVIDKRVIKMKQKIQFLPRPVYIQRRCPVRHPDPLTNRNRIIMIQHFAPHLPQKFMHPRAVRIGFLHHAVKIPKIRIRPVRALRNQRNHIHPKPVYSLIQPESHDVIHLLPHVWVLPIQIRLLF